MDTWDEGSKRPRYLRVLDLGVLEPRDAAFGKLFRPRSPPPRDNTLILIGRDNGCQTRGGYAGQGTRQPGPPWFADPVSV